MKTYIYFLILFIISCSANKQQQSVTTSCTYDDKISESDKTLNIIPYIKELDSKGYFTLTENDSIKISIVTNGDKWRKYTINKKYNIEKHILYDKKTLKVVKSFSFYNKDFFYIGNEYIYNEKGEVTTLIDHNQYNKYPICYKEIISTVLKKVNKKDTLHSLNRDSIKDTNDKYNYVWNVYLDRVENNSNENKKNSFRVNAKTGVILKSWISISTPD